MSKRKSISLFAGLVVLLIVLFAHSSVLASNSCQAGDYTITCTSPCPSTILDSTDGTCPADVGYPCKLFNYEVTTIGTDLSKVTQIHALINNCLVGKDPGVSSTSGNKLPICRGDTNTSFGNYICGGYVLDINPTLSEPNNTFSIAAAARSGVDNVSFGISWSGRNGDTAGCDGGAPLHGLNGPGCADSGNVVLTSELLDSKGQKWCLEGDVAVNCSTGEELPSTAVTDINFNHGKVDFIETVGGSSNWLLLSDDAPDSTCAYNPRTGRCYWY
jgi:hypothetical protein